MFPSPYWGLFFYQNGINGTQYYPTYREFPSPYWGLFFYPPKGETMKDLNLTSVSVPVLGIIFLSPNQYHIHTKQHNLTCFRPRTGDYFFYRKTKHRLTSAFVTFLSPYWGLFFYQKGFFTFEDFWNEARFPSPYWGLFFYLYCSIRRNIMELIKGFPSPCWGLFFYRIGDLETEPLDIACLFPSPCWGLFFYPYPL